MVAQKQVRPESVERSRCYRVHFAVIVGLAGWFGPAPAARADNLDQELYRQTPRILQYLREKKYQNVGVLKFRIKKGDDPTTDNAGTLNLTLAQRVEMALVLKNDVRSPLGIIHDASAVAAKVPGANHLRKDERQLLFKGRYPLAWGNQEVQADAFITGTVQISADLRQLTIHLLAFKPGSDLERVVPAFDAATDPGLLVEINESFHLRGLTTRAIDQAALVKGQKDQHPLGDRAAAVSFEIQYDGKPVPFELRDGKAAIPEPGAGQKVVLVLKHTGSHKERLGVVLKVNGENTLARERHKDVECRKWILDPGDPATVIRGFQTQAKLAEEFRILSRAESKQAEMQYGADVGTIALTVFREFRGKEEPPALTDEAEDMAVLSRGIFPREKSDNLAALQAKLRKLGANRGLIAPGARVDSPTQPIKFRPDATPLMAVAITYYRP